MGTVAADDVRLVKIVLRTLLVFGLLMFAAGVFLIADPHESLKVIMRIIGVVLLIDGVLALVGAAVGRVEGRGTLAIVGVLGVIVGLFLIRRPDTALTALVIVIGIWFIVAGITRAVYAFSDEGNRLRHALWALVDVIAGIVVLTWQHITLSTLGVIVGIVFVIRGLLCAYTAWAGLRLAREGADAVEAAL